MEVFIRDEEKKHQEYSLWAYDKLIAEDGFRKIVKDTTYSQDFDNDLHLEVKSLEQHDSEIRKPLEDEIERFGRLCDKLNKDYLEQKEISAYGMKELNNTIRQLKQAKQEVIDELLEMLSHDLTLYTPHSFEYDNPDLRLFREREKITKDLKEKLTELKGEKDE